MKVPIGFEFLNDPNSPKMIIESMKFYGLKEKVGPGSNPIILGWAKELGLNDYTDDSIPWCGLGMAKVAKDSGKTVPNKPLWARNWLNFGVKMPEPAYGDVMVFSRGSAGHVGLYVGESKNTYYVYGANTGDAWAITEIAKSRFLGARVEFKIMPPESRRVIMMQPGLALKLRED